MKSNIILLSTIINIFKNSNHIFYSNCSLLGSGISTHTLDSGIGTFPLPDYSANAGCKSITKGKAYGESDPSHLQGKHGSGMKMSHKAWTLERELSSLEEDYMGGQDMDHHTGTLENKIPSTQIANIVHDGI